MRCFDFRVVLNRNKEREREKEGEKKGKKRKKRHFSLEVMKIKMLTCVRRINEIMF